MQKQIDGLFGHYILAGIGRVGREAAAELKESNASVVVIDPSPEVEAFARELNILRVRGDATEDAVLLAAGVKRAKGVIVTTSDDATNLYVILSARILNPGLFIASRAVDETSVKKLIRAGADRAISPYAIGGRRLAHLMLSPRVVDFFETAMKKGNKALNIDDLLIAQGSSAAGKTVESMVDATGAAVLAVMREGNAHPNPKPTFVLSAGDHLLVLGTAEQLQQLEGTVS